MGLAVGGEARQAAKVELKLPRGRGTHTCHASRQARLRGLQRVTLTIVFGRLPTRRAVSCALLRLPLPFSSPLCPFTFFLCYSPSTTPPRGLYLPLLNPHTHPRLRSPCSDR